MNKKIAATLIFIIFLLSLSSAYVYATITFQQTATVSTTGTVVYTLDGVAFSVGPIAWGTINPGQTLTKALNISNGRNEPVTPILISTLPAEWSQTWNLNNTVVAKNTNVAGSLTLTAPSNATAGAVSISSSLTP